MSIAEKPPPPKNKNRQPEQQATNAGATMQRWILIALLTGIFLLLIVGGGFTAVVFGIRAAANAQAAQKAEAQQQENLRRANESKAEYDRAMERIRQDAEVASEERRKRFPSLRGQ